MKLQNVSNRPSQVASRPPLRRSLVTRVRDSVWFGVAWRAFAVAFALSILAWIGRTAAAGPPAIANATPPPASSAHAETKEAGADLEALTAPPPHVPASTPPPSGTSRGRASADDPVFLNHAGADELRRLPGVGAKRADAILALRQRLGKFRRVEDLLRTKGIGRAAIKKWRPLVRLDAPNAEVPDGGAG